MSDTDFRVALMEAGRMNLMHLPPGAIAWLWDRPSKQIDAAEALAVAANAYGNPVSDASLLKADQNILLIKCQGGECFRVYPDGGYSYNEAPMDIGGCSSVLQGQEPCGGEPDEMGHMVDPSPGDGYNDAMDVAVMDDTGNHEHMDTEPPQAGMQDLAGLTNFAGEPTQDQNLFDGVGEVDGPGAGDGMGTGSPYSLEVGYELEPSQNLENQMMSRELGEFRIKDLDNSEVDMLAEELGLSDFELNEADPPGRIERTSSGQYRHTFDKMCICGHTNGEHTAERVKFQGEWHQPCLAEDDGGQGFGEPCECEVFTAVKKPRRKKA